MDGLESTTARPRSGGKRKGNPTLAYVPVPTFLFFKGAKWKSVGTRVFSITITHSQGRCPRRMGLTHRRESKRLTSTYERARLERVAAATILNIIYHPVIFNPLSIGVASGLGTRGFSIRNRATTCVLEMTYLEVRRRGVNGWTNGGGSPG